MMVVLSFDMVMGGCKYHVYLCSILTGSPIFLKVNIYSYKFPS